MENNKQLKNNDCFKSLTENRRTWRKFLPKKIDEKTVNKILNNTLYCPSSFGLEPWKIVIISNEKLKKELEPLCDNQEQVKTCSHLFLVLSYKGNMFAIDNPWMIERCKTKKKLDTKEKYENFYHNHFMRYMKQINDWDQWSIRQSYILLENILLSATSLNLGSSPLEGIDINGIVKFLENRNIIKAEDHNKFNCPFAIALGYMDNSYVPRIKNLSDFQDNFIIIE